ncbi:MAG: ASCH domain-containing protein [Marinifilum sp.]|jgi:hypothetical protein|nr:ASCH domain-containing protein [Marinifilum sp.]
MKALSIRQPWAWAIVHGYKPVENRSWKTNFRGRIYIHASKTFDKEGYEMIKEHAQELGIKDMPKPEEIERGGIVGTATLTNCVSEYPSPWYFGEYGFVLENAKPLNFIPCKGKLNFFKPEIEMKNLELIKDNIEKIRQEILKDDISWYEIETVPEDIASFDFFDKKKHEPGYSTLQLIVQADNNGAVFVCLDSFSGYYKTYAELKENLNIKLGEVHQVRGAGGTRTIKFY